MSGTEPMTDCIAMIDSLDIAGSRDLTEAEMLDGIEADLSALMSDGMIVWNRTNSSKVYTATVGPDRTLILSGSRDINDEFTCLSVCGADGRIVVMKTVNRCNNHPLCALYDAVVSSSDVKVPSREQTIADTLNALKSLRFSKQNT